MEQIERTKPSLAVLAVLAAGCSPASWPAEPSPAPNLDSGFSLAPPVVGPTPFEYGPSTCTDRRLLAPKAPDGSLDGAWLASAFFAEQPFAPATVRYPLANFGLEPPEASATERIGCFADQPHDLLLWVQDPIRPLADPAFAVLHQAGVTSDDPVVTNQVDISGLGLRLETGERLVVAIQLAGGWGDIDEDGRPESHSTCAVGCSSSDDRFWVSEGGPPFDWATRVDLPDALELYVAGVRDPETAGSP